MFSFHLGLPGFSNNLTYITLAIFSKDFKINTSTIICSVINKLLMNWVIQRLLKSYASSSASLFLARTETCYLPELYSYPFLSCINPLYRTDFYINCIFAVIIYLTVARIYCLPNIHSFLLFKKQNFDFVWSVTVPN